MFKMAVGSTLLATAVQGWALSLGAVQGQVIIGRPLDILVQSSIDAAEAASGVCLEATVMYGDARVPAQAVTATVQRTGADGSGAVRVRVTEPVTEPIVTVVLKAGCPTTFKRSYALLADVESVPATRQPLVVPAAQAAPVQAPLQVAPVAPARPEPTRVPAPTAARAAPPAPPPAKPSAPPPAPVSAAPETPVRLTPTASRPPGVTRLRTKLRPPTVAQPLPADATSKVASSPLVSPASTDNPAGPRLKLDPLDLTPTAAPAAPVAANSPSDPALPAGGTAPEAAAADPAAAPANAPAPGVGQELQALRAEQERLRLAVETMNAQLTQAESGRYQNPVVYGLGAAVLGLLGTLAAVLWRRRRLPLDKGPASVSNPWWETGLPPVSALEDASAPAAPGAAGSSPAWHQTNDVSGLEVREAGESMFREVPVTPLDASALLDLWQQVDFFESMGQSADAMAALRAFVSDHPRACEAPYLRWLALARHSQQAEEQAVAQAFYEHHFQRLVPASADAAPLDEDTAFLAGLVRVWPGPEAQRWLVSGLASQPGDPAAPLKVRSLAAFDDLLALLGTWDLLAAWPEEPALNAVVPVVTAAVAAPLAPVTPPQDADEPVASDSLPMDFAEWNTVSEVLSGVQPAAAPVAEPPPAAKAEDPLDFDFFQWEAAPAPEPAPDSPKQPAKGQG